MKGDRKFPWGGPDFGPSKQRIYVSIITDYMILYIKNPKDATKKQLELINEFHKVAVTKLIYRNWFHFYTLRASNQ